MAGEPHNTACVRRSRARGQSGATLIEIIVVMAVAIPVILAAAVGLLTTVRLSGATEQQQQAEAQATAFAESVKQIPYVPCAVRADYENSPELWVAPTGVTVQIVDVAYWNQTDRDYTSTTCASAADDLGAQLVTVRAVTSERSAVLEVVKRDPDASAEVATP